jgi:hypothetical protein
MSLPFTTEQFWQVMRSYNEGVWPAQLALNALAVALVALLATPLPSRHRWIAAGLAFLFAWTGIAYHWRYFYDVNAAAAVFGLLFLAAGALIGWHGVIGQRLHFEPWRGARGLAGMLLIVYALVVYPALGLAFGHGYPAMPTFGAPCPTILFAIGMLALLRAPYPRQVFVLPIVWALIGTSAAHSFGVYEDYGLAIAALAGAWFALQPRLKERLA